MPKMMKACCRVDAAFGLSSQGGRLYHQINHLLLLVWSNTFAGWTWSYHQPRLWVEVEQAVVSWRLLQRERYEILDKSCNPLVNSAYRLPNQLYSKFEKDHKIEDSFWWGFSASMLAGMTVPFNKGICHPYNALKGVIALDAVLNKNLINLTSDQAFGLVPAVHHQ